MAASLCSIVYFVYISCLHLLLGSQHSKGNWNPRWCRKPDAHILKTFPHFLPVISCTLSTPYGITSNKKLFWWRMWSVMCVLGAVVMGQPFSVGFPHTGGRVMITSCVHWRAGTAVIYQWLILAATLTKEQKQDRIEVDSVCYPFWGNVLIAETANADKQMSLGDTLIISLYPCGFIGLWEISLWAC